MVSSAFDEDFANRDSQTSLALGDEQQLEIKMQFFNHSHIMNVLGNLEKKKLKTHCPMNMEFAICKALVDFTLDVRYILS